MNINKIDNNNNFTFTSKITPTKTLDSTFKNAIINYDREFLKSIKGILRDGQDRTVSVSVHINNNKYDMTTLTISDRASGYWARTTSKDNMSLTSNIINDIKTVINNFARKELKLDNSIDSYTKETVQKQLEKLRNIIFKPEYL